MKSPPSLKDERPWYLQEEAEEDEEAQGSEESEAKHESKTPDSWQGYLPGFVKRSIALGSQYIPRSEDVLKNWLPTEVVKEFASMPKEIAKEVAKATLSQADRLKTEILKLVASETQQFLRQMHLGEELQKLLAATTLEIEMKIRFRPEPGSSAASPKVEELQIIPTSAPPPTSEASEPRRDLPPPEPLEPPSALPSFEETD